MQNVIVELKIIPLGTEATSLSGYIAELGMILKNYKDLKSKLTPMSTIIEGDLDTIFKAVRELHESPFQNGAKRVSTQISIDDRRDKKASMESKVKSVKNKMNF